MSFVFSIFAPNKAIHPWQNYIDSPYSNSSRCANPKTALSSRRAKEAMFPTMVEARPIRRIVAAASLAMSSPSVTKVAVAWSLVCTTTIRTVSQALVRRKMLSDNWSRTSIAIRRFVQRFTNSTTKRSVVCW